MGTSTIYKIQSIIKPERSYVGSTNNVNRRWDIHLRLLRKGKHHSVKLQNHYNKHGESDLVFIILEPCFPEFLIIREQFYINKERPYFNIAKKAGSKLGVPHSENTRKNMSISHMGNDFGFKKGFIPWNKGKKNLYKHTEKWKKTQSEQKKGHAVSEETRRKLREKNKGKVRYICSEETREKMRNRKDIPSRKGTKWSKEQREKMVGRKWTEEQRIKLKGKIPWNKGKTGVYSEETLAAMRNAKKKRA